MIVIKVGGGKDIDVDAVGDDLAAMRQEGREILLVHGGAETTNDVATMPRTMTRTRKPSPMKSSRRKMAGRLSSPFRGGQGSPSGHHGGLTP